MLLTIKNTLDVLQGFLNVLPPTIKYVIIATVVFLFFIFLRRVFTKYIFKLILKLFSKTNLEIGRKILLSFENPMQILFIAFGLYFAVLCLPVNLEQNIVVTKILRSSIILLITWGFYNLSDVDSVIFKLIQEQVKVQLDKILFTFLSKFLKVILILLSLTIVAEEWGYNINGLIAGLGLGGLAFALAAKDSLSNIFAGLVIILDKPFSLGDWIKTPSVEGTVEDMTFRSTKVKTFAQAVVTVPNSVLANESIINWSKMGKRRITFQLGVTYSTPKNKLEKCISDIKMMLENHPEIHKETIFVNFDNFGDSSLNIFLYFFTNTTRWGDFLKVKEDINFKIMGILEKEGVSAAFPSSSVYFETPLTTQTIVEQ
ncbi:MAG: mechanosensitive ion channel family protein [Clostridia bacterium]|nr:mechanosensitive ion channel family protein [Clostridia bacterium]MDD4047293.1 mechanosensitive ion channel family protein [Clostridia bacterium]